MANDMDREMWEEKVRFFKKLLRTKEEVVIKIFDRRTGAFTCYKGKVRGVVQRGFHVMISLSEPVDGLDMLDLWMNSDFQVLRSSPHDGI